MLVKVTGSVFQEDMLLALPAFLALEERLSKSLKQSCFAADRLVVLVYAGAQDLLRGDFPRIRRNRTTDGDASAPLSDLTVQMRFGEDIQLSSEPDHLALRIARALSDDVTELRTQRQLSKPMRKSVDELARALTELVEPPDPL